MQKRYCTCGHAVWVLYTKQEQIWYSTFWLDQKSGLKIYICPGCGQSLNIDHLR